MGQDEMEQLPMPPPRLSYEPSDPASPAAGRLRDDRHFLFFALIVGAIIMTCTIAAIVRVGVSGVHISPLWLMLILIMSAPGLVQGLIAVQRASERLMGIAVLTLNAAPVMLLSVFCFR